MLSLLWSTCSANQLVGWILFMLFRALVQNRNHYFIERDRSAVILSVIKKQWQCICMIDIVTNPVNRLLLKNTVLAVVALSFLTTRCRSVFFSKSRLAAPNTKAFVNVQLFNIWQLLCLYTKSNVSSPALSFNPLIQKQSIKYNCNTMGSVLYAIYILYT